MRLVLLFLLMDENPTSESVIETPEMYRGQENIAAPEDMRQEERRNFLKLLAAGGTVYAANLLNIKDAEGMYYSKDKKGMEYDENHPEVKKILDEELVESTKAALLWINSFEGRMSSETYEQYRTRKEQMVNLWKPPKNSLLADSSALISVIHPKNKVRVTNKRTGKKFVAFHHYGVACDYPAYPNKLGGGLFCTVDLGYNEKSAEEMGQELRTLASISESKELLQQIAARVSEENNEYLA